MRTTTEADVTLVLDFLNTLDVDSGADALEHTDSWRAWAAARDLRPGPVAEARSARSSLRAAAGDPTVEGEAVAVPVRVEVTPAPASTASASVAPATSASVTPADSAASVGFVADSAVGSVLVAAARLSLLGEFARIKICPADNCRWAFYDRSRNRSRSWCSMSACGNREKARAWRQRSAATRS